MPSALFLTPFGPDPAGHGGNRRAYQILSDLGAVVGPDHVRVMVVATAGDPAAGARGPWRHVRRAAGQVAWKLALSVENPASVVARNTFYSRCFTDRHRRQEAARLLEALPPPVVVVVEHAALLDLLPKAAPSIVGSIACPQNLESLDVGTLVGGSKRAAWATAIDLANEVRALARADVRLCISTVETAMLNGVGLAAQHYPYVPAGETRRGLEAVRSARAARTSDRGLFVMLGSAVHRSTGDSMAWLVRAFADLGLPDGWRVVVAGQGTERFTGVGGPGCIEARGWIPDAERDDLLTRCAAVLAPQRTGFGALTRLPELSCAGVPALVSRHALAMLEPPPGAAGVDDEPGAWLAAMRNHVESRLEAVAETAYLSWAQRQPHTLTTIVRDLFDRVPHGGRPGAVPASR